MERWENFFKYAECCNLPREKYLLPLKAQYDSIASDPKQTAEFDRMTAELDVVGAPLKPEDFWGEKAGRQTAVLLILAHYPRLEAAYAKAGYSREMLKQIAGDLFVWLSQQTMELGYVGLTQRIFSWEADCASGHVKQFGRLQCNDVHKLYMPASFFRRPDGTPEYRPCPQEGHLPGSLISFGDEAVNIHIPASGPMLREECIASLRRMADFMKKFHPEIDWKGFVCYSWLLDPVLQELLPENSNIVAFQRLGHYFPCEGDATNDVIWRIFGPKALKEGIDAVPHTTRMQKILADYFHKGGKIRESGFFIPRDEASSL